MYANNNDIYLIDIPIAYVKYGKLPLWMIGTPVSLRSQMVNKSTDQYISDKNVW